MCRMYSDVAKCRRISWVIILACLLHIRAEEPQCYYLDMERRLSENLRSLESQNDKILDRLVNMEGQLEGKKEQRQMSPPFNYVLQVEDLEYDDRTMVFRATAGNGYNVFDAWTQGKGTCDNKPETMERSLSCHYRSNRVTSWSHLKVDMVKFALYNPDRELGHVSFDGRDSDLSTWFDKSRIVSSSWSDLTPTHTFNKFSIVGDYREGGLDRRFQINRVYGGCDADMGHVVTVDTLTVPETVCKWDKHVTHPQFLYSKINSADIWNNAYYGRAQYMAILIKTY